MVGAAALTINAVTDTTGGPKCGLADGAISCTGKLAPPQCLCTGSGGSVTITFTATGAVPTIRNGVPLVQVKLVVHARHRDDPGPRLIPDAVQPAKRKNV